MHTCNELTYIEARISIELSCGLLGRNAEKQRHIVCACMEMDVVGMKMRGVNDCRIRNNTLSNKAKHSARKPAA